MNNIEVGNENKTEQQPATPTVDIKAFKDQLDKSSELNRNLGLFSVGFFVYMLITTIGVSDRQLVLLDQAPTGIVLSQLLSLTLPVMEFAKYAPVMVLAIHLNLLINLLEHAGKLYHWKSNMVNTESDELLYKKQLHPFMFNQATIQSGSWVLGLTKVLVKMSAFSLPMLTLFYFEFRFADLHMRWLTNWHWFIFSIDTILVLGFYAKTFTDLAPVDFSNKMKFFFRNGGLLVDGINQIIWDGKQEIIKDWILFQWFKIKQIITRSSTTNSQLTGTSRGFDICRLIEQTAFLSLTIASFLYWFIVQTITDPYKYKSIVSYMCGDNWGRVQHFYWDRNYQKDSILNFIPGDSAFTPSTIIKLPIPILTVSKQVLAFSTPSTQEIIMAKQAGVSDDSTEYKYTKGINFQNRDFTLADFHECHLIKAELNRSVMHYANFSSIIGDGASFVKSNGEKISFENSNIPFSKFTNSDMPESNFKFANISRGNFKDIKLGYSSLKYTKAICASFIGVDFFRSDLSSSNFICSNFSYSFITLASLANSNISHCDFSNANMIGVDFTESVTKESIYINTYLFNSVGLYQSNNEIFFRANFDNNNSGFTLKEIDSINFVKPLFGFDGRIIRYINKKNNYSNALFKPTFFSPIINDFLFHKELLEDRTIDLHRIFLSKNFGMLFNSFNLTKAEEIFFNFSFEKRNLTKAEEMKINDFIQKYNELIQRQIKEQKLYWRYDEFNKLVGDEDYPGLTRLELPKIKNP